MQFLPEGTSRFTQIIRDGSYYVDKTAYISRLESLGRNFLFFVRPRRFGKSIFISMLKTYYDMRYRDQFAHHFKGTYKISPLNFTSLVKLLSLSGSRIFPMTLTSPSAKAPAQKNWH